MTGLLLHPIVCVVITCADVGQLGKEEGGHDEHRWVHVLASTKRPDHGTAWRCQTFMSMTASQSVAQVVIFFFSDTCHQCCSHSMIKCKSHVLVNKQVVIFWLKINHLMSKCLCIYFRVSGTGAYYEDREKRKIQD
jgi:hypothetical protein